MLRNYLILFLFVISSLINAQGGFNSRIIIPNSSYHVSKAIYEIGSGNYLAFGHVTDTLNGKSYGSLVIMGLDANGQVQWSKKIGNSNFSYYDDALKFKSFYRNGNCIYYIGPAKNSHTRVVGVLIKFNLNGDTLWQKVFSDPNDDVIPQMATRSVDGGFLLSGWFQDWINHTSPGLIIKTDSLGNEIWRKHINKAYPNAMDGRGIVQDSSSKKIIIVGYQYKFKQTDLATFESLLILDSLGNKLQQLSHTEGVAFDIIQTNDKNFVVVGKKNNSYNHHAFAYKFDINNPGAFIWQNFNFGDPSETNYFSCIKELANGNILISGAYDTTEAVTGFYHGLNRITQLKSNGELIKHRYYDYVKRDSNNCAIIMMSLELTGDGGWTTATKFTCYSATTPFLFNKYDSSGCDSSTAYCATMNLVGVTENKNEESDFMIFPNPAQDNLQFQFSTTTYKSNYHLKIFNSLGQLVREEDVEIKIIQV